MPIRLRCPGCSKVYRLADDRAGKQAKCRCGVVMKVPAGASTDGPAWEDEVNRAFGPSPVPEPQETGPSGGVGSPTPNRDDGCHAHVPVGMDDGHGHKDVAMPHEGLGTRGEGRGTDGHGREDVAMPPRTPSSWAATFANIDFRRLVKKEPWRAVFGLAAIVYGVAAAIVILSSISLASVDILMFGDAANRLVQAALAGAIAFGGLLILKKDKNGPACAGLAAVLLCFVPMWGLIPGLRSALATEQLAPFLWLVAEYAVPMALMVWCLKEETRRQGWHGS